MEYNNLLLDEIMSNFKLSYNMVPYGDGHINDTYASSPVPKYLLQRINTQIFTNPDELMQNIEAITSHLRKKIEGYGGNCDRETLTVVKTIDDKLYYRAENGSCYRVYKFISDTKSVNQPENPEMFEEAAKAFGRFQNMLADFDASVLHETIKDFHNTPKRILALKEAVEKDVAGRRKETEELYDEFMKYEKLCSIIQTELDTKRIPLRVTHNDTKLNNILFDAETGKGLCVIDLDTVMPGSLLFDYGDSLRFGASTAKEDEADLEKVQFSLEYFESFTKGFLSELGAKIEKTELELLPVSALTLTFECGIRFLTDYLNGDTYFKIHYPDQNLVRAKNQLKLCKDIYSKLDEMLEIVLNCYSKSEE